MTVGSFDLQLQTFETEDSAVSSRSASLRGNSSLRLLVADRDATLRQTCADVARFLHLAASTVASTSDLHAAFVQDPIDILLLDPRLPGHEGAASLLQELRAAYPDTSIVVMTANASVRSAVDAMRLGAADYLSKPFSIGELTTVLERTAERKAFEVRSRALRERMNSESGFAGLVGRSAPMEKVYRILSKVVFTTHPVLVLGESGTGKEVVAKAIHDNGPNAAKPFVTIDCGSLVPTLIESELFGHAKGSFTSAGQAKVGLLAAAEGGTVFLDEIGELPLELQARLLRALQEKEIRPVGSTQIVPISARILAATNRDLAQMVRQGQFRKDRFYRLNVVNVRIPSLRERRGDIPLLLEHFLERQRQALGAQFTFAPDAMRAVESYDWPGNVRELEHAIERVCALSTGPILRVPDLPTEVQAHAMRESPPPDLLVEPIAHVSNSSVTSIAEMEKQAILSTIQQLHGDKLAAARLLGIGKTTLYRKLKEYELAVAEDSKDRDAN
jgi:DNA-binding NtrC family response regulator